MDKHYESMSKGEDKPAILSIIPKHSDKYVVQHGLLSVPLSTLFQETFAGLPLQELFLDCELAFARLSISPEQARGIELSTSRQALPKDWFWYRTGHVTASPFQSSFQTDPVKTSISIIKARVFSTVLLSPFIQT